MNDHAVRDRFLRALKKRAADLDGRCRASLPPSSAVDAAYVEEARRRLARAALPVPVAELRRRLGEGADAVVGEHHMLAPSLAAAAKLLEWRLDGGAPPLLALGLLREEDEGPGRDTLAGRRSLDSLERRLAGTWPADPRLWRPLLRLARRAGLELLGCRPAVWPDLPARLDGTVARLRPFRERGRGIFVVDGDFHAAPLHLPTALREVGGRPLLSVAQNEDRHGWPVFASAVGGTGRLVRWGRDDYHLVSAHPLRKLEAHLAWLEEAPELAPAPLPPFRPGRVRVAGLGAALSRLLRRIARLLRIDGGGSGGEDLVVLTPEEPERLVRAVAEGHLGEEELESLWGQVETGRSWFRPGSPPLIYLADLRVDHVAEELFHWLHGALDRTMETGASEGLDVFHEHVAREALAFAGTRILRPERPTPGPAELAELVRGGEGSEAGAALWALRYLFEAQRELAPWFDGFMAEPLELRVGTIHLLGYGLGAWLHDRDPLRVRRKLPDWFRLPLGLPGRARAWVEDALGRISSPGV